MSDVISNFFGRTKTDASEPAEQSAAVTSAQPAPADVVTAPEPFNTNADAATEPASTEQAATESVPAEALDAEITVEIESEPAEVSQAAIVAETEAGGETTEDEAVDTATEESAEQDGADVAGEDAASADEAETEPVAEAEETAETETEAVTETAESVDEETEARPRPAAGTRGSTTVGDGVVSKLITMVARKAEGVHDLAPEGVVVAVEDGVATVKLSLVIEFGHAVKTLAGQLRVDVIDAVESYLGLEVAAVDVEVTDIHLPDAA